MLKEMAHAIDEGAQRGRRLYSTLEEGWDHDTRTLINELLSSATPRFVHREHGPFVWICWPAACSHSWYRLSLLAVMEMIP
jgi:hypothetical protein